MKSIGKILYSYNKLPTYIKAIYFLAFAFCSITSMQLPHPYSDVFPMLFAVPSILVLIDLLFTVMGT